MRPARALIEKEAFAPKHLSELAAVLGTIEYSDGKIRRMRRLLETALLDPTENAVAQVGWLARQDATELPDKSLAVPRAFEARAWEAAMDRDFTGAVANARSWLNDEPFSARPAIFGGWVAATAQGDYAVAYGLGERALRANADDPRILANIVFCLVMMGRIDEAEQHLVRLQRSARAEAGSGSSAWDVYIAADRGLIAFRRGDPAAGRDYYDRALDLAAANGWQEAGASAFLHYVREEIRVSPMSAPELLRDAEAALMHFEPAARLVQSRLIERPIE